MGIHHSNTVFTYIMLLSQLGQKTLYPLYTVYMYTTEVYDLRNHILFLSLIYILTITHLQNQFSKEFNGLSDFMI